MAGASSHYFNLVQSTEKRLRKQSAEQIPGFLQQGVDLDFIADSLSAVGITRCNFTSPPAKAFCPPLSLTNGFVIELEQYRISQNLRKKDSLDWIVKLSGLPLEHLPYTVDNCFRSYLKLLKNKHRDPHSLEQFLSSKFSSKVSLSEVKSDNNIKEQPLTAHKKTNVCDKCVGKSDDIKNLKAILVEEQKKHLALMHEHSALIKDNKKQKIDLKASLSTVEELKQTLKELKRQKIKAENDVQKVKEKLSALQKQSLAIRRSQSRIKLKRDAHVVSLKKDVKKLKSSVAHFKKENLKLRESSVVAQPACDIDFKFDTNNTYTDDVRQAVISLHSEAGVAAGNVEKVIKIVSEKIFHHQVTDRLPCGQTVINMCNEASIISGFQTAEKILDSNNVTIHLDGTSRDQRKIVGHQVTLDNGDTLYLGFTPVACEDAPTLLDITINIFKKLSDCYVYCSENSIADVTNHSVLKEIYKRITSTMSDRAATMKSFDRKFHEFLKSEVGENVVVHFLHCNAHFLLGLSASCEKAMVEAELHIKQKEGRLLGRDCEPQFNKFLTESESATSRLIRTACDILGPRGDQKNGYRVDWTAFCPDSLIPCFKGNRFNCYFEAAAALIYHCDKIKLFFSSGVLPDSVNLKVKSVCHDIHDEKLMICICAIALFYIHVTGPYWNLVNSSIKYGDFHSYVKELHSKLTAWSIEPSRIISDSRRLFGSKFSISSKTESSVFEYARKCNQSVLLNALKLIAFECIQVTERQLSDFLTGSFSQPLTDDVSLQLSHCPLNNLVGESAFGDLDFDLKKRSNCSNFHRSATHMVKRNRTCQYLSSKSKTIRHKLFAAARVKNRILYKQSRDYEEHIRNKVREKMAENQDKKIKKRIDDISRQTDIFNKVKAHGGPCTYADDVDKLYSVFKSQNKTYVEMRTAFQNEIRYQKLIQVKPSKDLTLKGTVHDLIEKLKKSLSSKHSSFAEETPH